MTVTERGMERIRARAERELTDRVRIRRPQEPTVNPATGETTAVYTTPHGTLPALITAARGADVETSDPGRKPRTTDDYTARLPITADVERGDEVTVLHSGDPGLRGLTFTVATVGVGSHSSGRRVALTLDAPTRRA